MDDQLRRSKIIINLKSQEMSTTRDYASLGVTRAKSFDTGRSRGARIAYVSAAISLILIAILHGLRNDLVPAAHMVSEYAIGQQGWIMQLAFFAWAISCISLGTTIRSHLKTRGGRFGLVLLYIAGLALIMGGIFVIDSPYAEKQEPTLHGSLHGFSAMIGLPAQAIAGLLISYSLKRNTAWNQVRKPVILFAHLAWISLILLFISTFIMMGQPGGKFNGDTGIGWFNRLLILVYCTWLMVLAAKTIQVNRQHGTLNS
jgi:hypothetical protein